MNQPKLAITVGEAERVVRQLADSLNSLKTKPSAPASLAPVKAQQSPPPQKDRVRAVYGQSPAPCQLFHEECRRNQLRAPLQ